MTQKQYHYSECGLDNVYLLSGFDYVDTSYGPSVVIENIDGLHRAICKTLVHDKKRLNGKELRFLRHELNLSQTNLAMLLDIGEQVVANWEKGKTKNISGAAEKMVRILYQEHIGGNHSVTKLLRNLAELDELADEDMRFADTENGWEQAEAA